MRTSETYYVLQEVCEKFNDAQAFVRERIEELCSKKELSTEEVTYLVYIITMIIIL